jgi:hypothetical protein
MTAPADASQLQTLRNASRIWVVWMSDEDLIARWLPGVAATETGRLSVTQQIILGRIPLDVSTQPAPSPAYKP